MSKYLKLFESKAQYESWKGGSDYVTPNVAFNNESGLVYAPTNPNVVCVYDITDISRETLIMSGYAGYAYTAMIVDGVKMDFDCYYQFNTVGLHTVEFVFDKNYNTKMPSQGFDAVDQVVSITIPNSVDYIGDSAFYGCTYLKSVTMSEGVQYIGVHAFSGCESLI